MSDQRKVLVMKYGGIAAAGVMVGGTFIAFSGCEGCYGSRPRTAVYRQWAETRGQAGKIDLGAVEKAIQESKDVSEFERRVNEIYEGDELILIEVRNTSSTSQEISGYADRNSNSTIDAEDEKLFTFTRSDRTDGGADYSMVGYGANRGYYHSGSLTSTLLNTWLLMQVLRTPTYTTIPYYHTPRSRTVIIKQERDSYRRSPAYQNRVSSRPRTTTGTTTRQAGTSASKSRFASKPGATMSQTTKPKTTTKSRWGSFKSTFKPKTSTTSRSRSFSSSRSFGGFRGGGR